MTKRKLSQLPPLVEAPGQPGMGIINRYMPDASPEEKEAALWNLKRLVGVLVKIDDRLKSEEAATHQGAL